MAAAHQQLPCTEIVRNSIVDYRHYDTTGHHSSLPSSLCYTMYMYAHATCTRLPKLCSVLYTCTFMYTHLYMYAIHFVYSVQIHKITDDGIKFKQLYNVNKFPYVAIVDPRTGTVVFILNYVHVQCICTVYMNEYTMSCMILHIHVQCTCACKCHAHVHCSTVYGGTSLMWIPLRRKKCAY